MNFEPEHQRDRKQQTGRRIPVQGRSNGSASAGVPAFLQTQVANVPQVQRQAQPGAAAVTPATAQDKREFVQATIDYLHSAADYYRSATNFDEALVNRVLSSWQTMVTRQEEIIRTDLAGDEALLQDLRGAYQEALNVFVTRASTQLGQSEDQVYLAHRALIPVWAWPNRAVQGITTPLPLGESADASGRVSFEANGLTLVFLPDQQSRQPGTRTRIRINWGRVDYKSRNGVVTSFTGPGTPSATVQTTYGRGESAASPSAYGRGTTPTDVASRSTTLGHHESAHGLDYITYVREHPYPRFTGTVGMAVADFEAAIATWQQEWSQYDRDIKRYSEVQTDCVGTTIDDFNAAQGLITTICTTAP